MWSHAVHLQNSKEIKKYSQKCKAATFCVIKYSLVQSVSIYVLFKNALKFMVICEI